MNVSFFSNIPIFFRCLALLYIKVQLTARLKKDIAFLVKAAANEIRFFHIYFTSDCLLFLDVPFSLSVVIFYYFFRHICQTC